MAEPGNSISPAPSPLPLPIAANQLLWIMRGSLALLGLLTLMPWWHVTVNMPPDSMLAALASSKTASLFNYSVFLGLLVILAAWGAVAVSFFEMLVPRAPLAMTGGAVAALLLTFIGAMAIRSDTGSGYDQDLQLGIEISIGWSWGCWLAILCGLAGAGSAVLLNLSAIKSLMQKPAATV